MIGRYFISYSRVDQPTAERLYQALIGSSPPFSVFMDVHDIKPGQDWDEVLEQAAKSCVAMLFLMSADSIARGTQCKNEWGMALRCRRPVIPIKVEATVEPPMDFVRCQWVDISQDFNLGVQKLRDHLQWLPTPEGQLDQQRTLMALAERDWRRAASDQDRVRVQADIDRFQDEITRLERILEDGLAAKEL